MLFGRERNGSFLKFLLKTGQSGNGPTPARSDYLDKCPLLGCGLAVMNVWDVVVF
jgi:hypothetical protein